jgi:hypothetical protein
MTARLLVLSALMLAVQASESAPATPPPVVAFSTALDGRWDYGKPAESEARFRAELARWPQ